MMLTQLPIRLVTYLLAWLTSTLPGLSATNVSARKVAPSFRLFSADGAGDSRHSGGSQNEVKLISLESPAPSAENSRKEGATFLAETFVAERPGRVDVSHASK